MPVALLHTCLRIHARPAMATSDASGPSYGINTKQGPKKEKGVRTTESGSGELAAGACEATVARGGGCLTGGGLGARDGRHERERTEEKKSRTRAGAVGLS
eukprot:scaffold2635_cov106-Isochrysis_galbana.AAC.3